MFTSLQVKPSSTSSSASGPSLVPTASGPPAAAPAPTSRATKGKAKAKAKPAATATVASPVAPSAEAEAEADGVLVFDVETTGTDRRRDQVIELCVQYGLSGASKTWRFKPSVSI